MITLFPRDRAVCEWCGSEHPRDALCAARPGLSRRSFLFLGASAAVGLALAPQAVLQPSVTLGEGWTKGLTYRHAAVIADQYIPMRQIYAVIHISREDIERAAATPGAWVAALRAERIPGLKDLARTA